MRINSLATTNFGKLGTIYLDLSGAKVHLFCGPNESGKSTLSEAVRFVLVGDSPRIELKKNHDALITDGHTKGRIRMKYQETVKALEREVFRDVHSNGGASKDFKLDDFSIACMQIALQTRGFASIDAKDRRKLLTHLLEIQMSPKAIGDRLKSEDYGVAEQYVESILPILRAGFEPAHKAAKDEMSKARGAWEASTGEAFGTQKAKEWKPKDAPAPVDEAESKAATLALEAAEEVLEAAVSAIAHAQGATSARESLNKQRVALSQLKTQEKQYRNQKSVRQVQIAQAEADLTALREQLAWIEAAKDLLVCPNCDASLHMKVVAGKNVLQPKTVTDMETIDRGAGLPREDVVTQINDLEKKLRADQQVVADAKSKLEQIANADTLISEIDMQIGKLGDGKASDEMIDARDKARETKKLAQADVDRLREHSDAVARHAQKAEQAKKSAAAYFEWDKLADALAPEGLPAKLLSAALDPINKRLEASTALAGWPKVALNNDIELVRMTETEQNRPMSMLSESAQWRASAVMADAISSLSQLRILILDRADVIEPQSRHQLFKWCAQLAEDEYDTILIFATLKEKPKPEQVGGLMVHWMPDVVKNQSAPPQEK